MLFGNYQLVKALIEKAKTMRKIDVLAELAGITFFISLFGFLLVTIFALLGAPRELYIFGLGAIAFPITVSLFSLVISALVRDSLDKEEAPLRISQNEAEEDLEDFSEKILGK